MPLTESELLSLLKTAEVEKKEAQERLIKAKRELMHADTQMMEASLKMSRLQEALRILRNTTVNREPSVQDLEIEKFRQDYPELMEYIRKRDGRDS